MLNSNVLVIVTLLCSGLDKGWPGNSIFEPFIASLNHFLVLNRLLFRFGLFGEFDENFAALFSLQAMVNILAKFAYLCPSRKIS